MGTRLQRWLHKLKGHRSLYQYYATIHPSACEVCLRHHGEIHPPSDSLLQPPLHPECRCTLLEFPTDELEVYQERGQRMQEKAQAELQRRQLFLQAHQTLARSPAEALLLFQRSASIDIYVEEIEALEKDQAQTLRASPEIARQLRDLFVRAYKLKFEASKYQPLPEAMKSAQRAHGLHMIQELFRAYTIDSRGT
jgi:hypothetical protein